MSESIEVTAAEAARMLNVLPHTIRRWAMMGRLNSINSGKKGPGNGVRFLRSDIERISNSLLHEPIGVTAAEAAKMLGVTHQTILLWARMGKLNLINSGKKGPGNGVRFLHADIKIIAR